MGRVDPPGSTDCVCGHLPPSVPISVSQRWRAAPAYLAGEAVDAAAAKGIAADAYVINGFPLADDFMASIAKKYTAVITIEDGLIGTADAGLRGFAAFAAGHLASHVRLEHYGLGNPQVAPSEHFIDVWKHFGMSAEALTDAIVRLHS